MPSKRPNAARPSPPFTVSQHVGRDPGRVPARASDVQRESDDSRFRREAYKMWSKYSRHSTVHGVTYVASANASLWTRFCWGAGIAFGIGAMVCMCLEFMEDAHNNPIATTVLDTHLNPEIFAFPAVTLCPRGKIRRAVGEELLLKHVRVPPHAVNASLRGEMLSLMRVLTMIELPYVEGLATALKAAGRTHHFHNLNITNFMLQSMPQCEDLFQECTWHGEKMPCCKILHLQASSTGFCYSFNSLTSNRSRGCKTTPESQNAYYVATSTISVPGSPECELKRNTGFGAGSGLQVFFKELSTEDFILPSTVSRLGMIVCVHYATAVPRTITGYDIIYGQYLRVGIALSIENTVVSERVRNLPISVRNCVLVSERNLELATTYSYDTCLLECRVKEIVRVCKCYPYPFEGRPKCNLSQLHCMSRMKTIASILPPQSTAGVSKTSAQEALNCSHCWPTCQVVSYMAELTTSVRAGHPKLSSAGSVDVYYRDLGSAKLYSRTVTYTMDRFAIYAGSVAGLWLGMSLLSVVETAYYLVKVAKLLTIHLLQWRRIKKTRLRQRTAAGILLGAGRGEPQPARVAVHPPQQSLAWVGVTE